MKSKVGNFFFAFVPFALIFTILGMSQFPGTGLYMIFKFLTEGGEGLGSFLRNILFVGLEGEAYLDYAYFIQLLYAVTSIIVFSIWNRQFHKDKIDGNPFIHIKRKINWQMLVGILLLVVGAYYVVDIIMAVEGTIFPKAFEAYVELTDDMSLTDGFDLKVVLYAIVFGPVCEELCFRGAIYRHFRKAVPVWAAIVLQAVLFGVFHMNFIQGTYAFAIGTLMGYIYERGGSIINNILFHVLFNVVGTTALLSSFLGDTVAWMLFVICIGATFVAGGLIIYKLGVKKRDNVICSSSCPY